MKLKDVAPWVAVLLLMIFVSPSVMGKNWDDYPALRDIMLGLAVAACLTIYGLIFRKQLFRLISKYLPPQPSKVIEAARESTFSEPLQVICGMSYYEINEQNHIDGFRWSKFQNSQAVLEYTLNIDRTTGNRTETVCWGRTTDPLLAVIFEQNQVVNWWEKDEYLARRRTPQDILGVRTILQELKRVIQNNPRIQIQGPDPGFRKI